MLKTLLSQRPGGMKSDHELIKAVNDGNYQAFEQLYYRYRDWVYKLSYRFTSDPHQSSDVVQETFTYLLEKFPGFSLHCKMTSFLYPVVKHVSIRLAKRRDKRLTEPQHLAEVPAPRLRETDSTRQELAKVVCSLSAEQREVLLMRLIDELTFEEIANALNVGLSTAKSRFYRAVKKLRNDSRTREYFFG